MRQDRTLRGDVRGNALWGRRGESRSNALWGSGKRGIVLTALAAMLVVPMAGSAALGVPGNSAVVPKSLIAAATANPTKQFNVIVQGDTGSKAVGDDVQNGGGKIKKRFLTISGVNASVSGADILKLAKYPHVTAITPDVKVQASGYQDSTMWLDSTDMSILQNSFDPNTGAVTGPAPPAPASTAAARRTPSSSRSEPRTRRASLARAMSSRRPTGSHRTRSSTASASPTSRWRARPRRRSASIPSIRRSSAPGFAASLSSHQPA